MLNFNSVSCVDLEGEETFAKASRRCFQTRENLDELVYDFDLSDLEPVHHKDVCYIN